MDMAYLWTTSDDNYRIERKNSKQLMLFPFHLPFSILFIDFVLFGPIKYMSSFGMMTNSTVGMLLIEVAAMTITGQISTRRGGSRRQLVKLLDITLRREIEKKFRT